MLLTTTGSTPNNFLYNSEQYDSALGLYYLRARYYNPSTGRFETMDPYAGIILDPATLHKYGYAGDNPVIRVAAGLCKLTVVFLANVREGQ